MIKPYRRVLTTALLLCASFLYAQDIYAISLYGPANTAEAPSYKLKGTTYIPLILACESHNIAWEWDPVGKVVVLRKNGTEIRLKISSYRLYVNGRIKNLEKPPLLHRGTVVVPLSFAQKTIHDLFDEKISPVPVKGAAMPAIDKKHKVDLIVIDPGHGGKDPGAVSRCGNIKEKDLVLEVSKMLKEELKKSGIRVKLTRDRDIFIPLGKRAAMANDIEADFFISVHANASRSKRAKGFEVYFLSDASDDNARALAAAENASVKYEEKSVSRYSINPTVCDLELTENRAESRELADAVCLEVSRRLAVRNRGVKSANFYVLNGALMPAVLVEIGFISNTGEASNMQSEYYKRKLAEAVADGVLNYKREYEKTNGFTR